jgi:LacI family sucrose operon transcriptional repressor
MPTIKDVARKAGVTVTTVSRVLNNRGYISDATRKKVYEAMEELNYRPNELARSFHRNRSNIIGLIVPTVSNPFFARLTSYVEMFAYEHDYKVLICNSRLEQAKEQEYVDMLKSNRVDGIIMGSHTLDVIEFGNPDYPVVTFDRQLYNFPFVRSDNYRGGELATEHLIRKGCRKLAHICSDLKLNMFGTQRYEAFIDVANRYGVETVVVETDTLGFDRQECALSVANLFKNHPDVDGIFVSSDLVAFTVIEVCNQIGRRVPDDVRLVGYDDIELSSMFHPYLTTIRQPLRAMAECAVETLLKLINKEDVQREHTFPVCLIERETT